jgi:cellulose synthase (UDP-forming)
MVGGSFPSLRFAKKRARVWVLRHFNLGLLAAALGLTTLYMLWLGETQFSDSTQMYFGWGVFGVLVLLQTLHVRHPAWRIFFIVLAAFLSVRYLWWRTTQTLLWTGPLDFLGMTLIYLAEVYAICVHVIGLFSSLWPMERKPVPLPQDPACLPTVDVFIPTYNESEDIVRITAQAAVQIDYPPEKLRVYILDDGGTVAKRSDPKSSQAAWHRRYALMRMARELGASYLTREQNRQAKAGNINHALGKTSGELVLVLDCDHVPTREILQQMVGHFIADKRLFLVQSPHFFINPAPVEKNLTGVTRLPDEGDMFYGAVQPGLDTWNASYFCGSAALLRRRCLEEVGGLSGTTITEDVETAIALHSRGYRSVYLREPLVCGLAPESYDEFAIQRTRWAQGSTQVLLIHNPLFIRGLTLAQRICYANAAMFWFFGIPRLIYYLAPASFLVGGLYVYHVSFQQVMAYSLPFVFSNFWVLALVYARTRRPFFSEIYESVQSLFIIPAVWSVLRNAGKPSFRVTPKGQTMQAEGVTPLSAIFLAVIVMNVAALVAGGFRWQDAPEHRDVIAITFGWCLYNLYLGIMSMGAFWERRQIRKHHRIHVDGTAQVHFPRLGKVQQASLVDMSLTGMGLRLEADFEIKSREHVVIETQDSNGRAYRFEGTMLHARRAGQSYACGIALRHTSADYPKAVAFLYGDSRRWKRAWEARFHNNGTLKLVAILMRLGLRATVLSLFMLVREAGQRSVAPLRQVALLARKGWIAR